MGYGSYCLIDWTLGMGSEIGGESMKFLSRKFVIAIIMALVPVLNQYLELNIPADEQLYTMAVGALFIVVQGAIDLMKKEG